MSEDLKVLWETHGVAIMRGWLAHVKTGDLDVVALLIAPSATKSGAVVAKAVARKDLAAVLDAEILPALGFGVAVADQITPMLAHPLLVDHRRLLMIAKHESGDLDIVVADDPLSDVCSDGWWTALMNAKPASLPRTWKGNA